MSYFNASPKGIQELRTLHTKLIANTESRTKGENVVQPDLGLDKGNGIPDEKQMVYLEKLLKMIRVEEPLASKTLDEIAKRHMAKADGGHITISRGPVKTLDRILEKVDLKGRHFEVIRDYARASIIIDHVEQLCTVLEDLEAGPEFEILRVKNRFDPTYDSIESGGYRDYQLVVRVNGSKYSCRWLYEIQIMTREFYNLKTGNNDPNSAAAAHTAYKEFRRYKELGLRMQVQLDAMHDELKVLDKNFKNQGIRPANKMSMAIMNVKAGVSKYKTAAKRKQPAQEEEAGKKAEYLWGLTAKLATGGKKVSIFDKRSEKLHPMSILTTMKRNTEATNNAGAVLKAMESEKKKDGKKSPSPVKSKKRSSSVSPAKETPTTVVDSMA
jgi:hypothetical protein